MIVGAISSRVDGKYLATAKSREWDGRVSVFAGTGSDSELTHNAYVHIFSG